MGGGKEWGCGVLAGVWGRGWVMFLGQFFFVVVAIWVERPYGVLVIALIGINIRIISFYREGMRQVVCMNKNSSCFERKAGRCARVGRDAGLVSFRVRRPRPRPRGRDRQCRDRGGRDRVGLPSRLRMAAALMPSGHSIIASMMIVEQIYDFQTLPRISGY